MNTTYKVNKKHIKKLPVTSDTVDIVESLLASGKYTVPTSMENEMRELFDASGVFYTAVRR